MQHHMIKGISISDYLSIGDTQKISELGKINIFVGPNNSGKSNVLRFVNENLGNLVKVIHGDRQASMAPRPHLRRGKPTQAALCVSVSCQMMQKLFDPLTPQTEPALELLHKHLAPSDLLWIDMNWPSQELVKTAAAWIKDVQWQALWHHATKQSGGGLLQHWIPELLHTFKRFVPQELRLFAIPIDRRAGSEIDSETKSQSTKNQSARTLDGKGVIRSLAEMQNPQHNTFEEDRKRFKDIEDFVRTVTDDSSARISVTHKQDEILVQMKGQPYLPLASLGSGIEQVVLYAVAASTATNAVVTFEEPELHLHPVLQRQLLTYLATTSNQYFISTHSAHFIDAPGVDVYHVRLVEGQTIVEKANTDAKRRQVCDDLGYRPSDIVQANCIIWVEGPSDRVYIRHWLSQLDPDLREHVHFSVMFYGGKLLSHLSANETDSVRDGLDNLIPLRLLNRHVAVVIDSDRAKEGDAIRDTKQRVADEISNHGGLVWITAGREIENYVPHGTLSEAVEHVAPGRGSSVKKGTFAKVLPTAKSGSISTINKIETAKKVAEAGCGIDVLDLKERVQELSRFIRKANGLPVLESK